MQTEKPSVSDFTIAEFLAWARTKPADEQYNFIDSTACALAQFGMATGREHLVGPKGSAVLRSWPELQNAVCTVDGIDTFGRLVIELEALLPAEPVSDTWTTAAAYMADDCAVIA